MLGCDLLVGPIDEDTNTFADVNAMWFTGTTGPALSQGVDGDLYMNTVNGEIPQDVWSLDTFRKRDWTGGYRRR